MVERAIATGQAPALAEIVERGDAASTTASAAFPSVTPVCAATIATGARQDRHHIPAMNWYSRAERRYVEYGSSSRRAALRHRPPARRHRLQHERASTCRRGRRTVFEALDDADVRTAGTTYLMYRGRHRHELAREHGAGARSPATLLRRPVDGPARALLRRPLRQPRRRAAARSSGMPGVRDQHAGCVGAYLVEHDLFDFLLLSLPDNDTHSHKHGPHAQVESIAAADRQIERVMHAAGGTDAFLDEHAVIVVRRPLARAGRATDRRSTTRSATGTSLAAARPRAAERRDRAVPVAARGDGLRARRGGARDALLPRLVAAARRARRRRPRAVARRRRGRDRRRARGELRFAPGGDVARPRAAARWTRRRRPRRSLGAAIERRRCSTPDYPDALARVWAALTCPTSGDVLLSAAPGYEFPDWGGVAHVGGGSHGSLHRVDSSACCSWLRHRSAARARRRARGRSRDVAPMVGATSAVLACARADRPLPVGRRALAVAAALATGRPPARRPRPRAGRQHGALADPGDHRRRPRAPRRTDVARRPGAPRSAQQAQRDRRRAAEGAEARRASIRAPPGRRS